MIERGGGYSTSEVSGSCSKQESRGNNAMQSERRHGALNPVGVMVSIYRVMVSTYRVMVSVDIQESGAFVVEMRIVVTLSRARFGLPVETLELHVGRQPQI